PRRPPPPPRFPTRRSSALNPLAAAPHKGKLLESFAKLKFLIIMDPLVTETSEFWRNVGEFNDVDTAQIQTEVFRLPTTCFAEEEDRKSTRLNSSHVKISYA